MLCFGFRMLVLSKENFNFSFLLREKYWISGSITVPADLHRQCFSRKCKNYIWSFCDAATALRLLCKFNRCMKWLPWHILVFFDQWNIVITRKILKAIVPIFPAIHNKRLLFPALMIFTFVALCRLSGLSNEYQYEYSPPSPPGFFSIK